MSPPERHDPQALLAQIGWLRALARQLVLDQHLAEDLAQDACVAALEGTPQDEASLRGWLHGVVRNLALRRTRSELHRRDRELGHRAHAGAEGTDALVEQVEAQGELVRKVLELPETYRDVVLLHYFEGLPTRKVAAQLGISQTLVLRRLGHAHERLRASLERALGKDPQVWSLALLGVPLASLAKKAAATASPLAWSLTLAAALVAVVTGVTLAVQRTGGGSSGASATARPEPAGPRAESALATVGAPVRVAPLAPQAAPPASTPTAAGGAAREEARPEEGARTAARLRSAIEAAVTGAADVGVFVQAAQLVLTAEPDLALESPTEPDGTRVHPLTCDLPGVTASLCVRSGRNPGYADPALMLRLELEPPRDWPELAVGAARRTWRLELVPRADRDGRVDRLALVAELQIAAGDSLDLGVDLTRDRTPMAAFLSFSPDDPGASTLEATWIEDGRTREGPIDLELVGGATPDRRALQRLHDRLRELHAALPR